MQLLKANTAVDVLIGPFVDDTDGKTAETGLTLDVELSKNGQALANKNDATTPVHDGTGTIDGYYNCELDATDVNTEGTLTLVAFASGALPVRHEYMVMAEAAYDSLFEARDTGYMQIELADTANHGGTSAVVTLDHMIMDSAADHALYLNANAASKHALFAYAEGSNADGIRCYATTGKGIYGVSASGQGLHVQAGGANPGFQIDAGAGADTPGMKVNGGASGTAHAIELQPAGTGLPIADNGNNYIGVDIQAISADQTAAVNCESAFDGTGYNVGNGSIVAASVTGNVSGSINSLAAQAKTDVNNEVLDCLTTDQYAERASGSGPPAATASLKDKIVWLGQLARNSITNDGSTQTLKDDAGTGNVATASVSDAAGTTTRGKWS